MTLQERDQETRMAMETVSRSSKKVLTPRAADVDPSEVFPREFRSKLCELGIAGVVVAAEYGGWGSIT